MCERESGGSTRTPRLIARHRERSYNPPVPKSWTVWLDRLSLPLIRAVLTRALRRFERDARATAEVQRRVLLELLRRNAESDFGREHGFISVRGIDDYRRRTPIRDHAHLSPWLDRVEAGQTQALFAPGERVLMFALSSGSTNRPKMIPVTPEFVRHYRRGWQLFGYKALVDHPGCFVRDLVQVVSPMDERRTALGVPCGAISGLLASTQRRLVRRYYAVPRETAYLSDPTARYYTIMRFAAPRDVAWVVTASPATTLQLVRAARDHAERLIRDVHDGTWTPPGEAIRTEAAASLRRDLRPDPASARRLARCAEARGALLPRDYWRLGFLANWTGGTLGLHLGEFPQFFGDTPVRDIGLLATEGRVTFGVDDATPSGVLDVQSAFFEFAPVEFDAGGEAQTLLAHELTKGETYRVILTNAAGLYRYDLGDYVRATGFLGTAPLLEFLHRGARVASMTGEKLTEWQVVEAFRRACEARGIEPGVFVLAPQWGDPPHYRLYLEGAKKDPSIARKDPPTSDPKSQTPDPRSPVPGPRDPRPDTRLTTLANTMDQALSELNMEYGSKRRSNRLGVVRVAVLPAGTLADIDTRLQQRHGASREQFKRQYLHTQPRHDDELSRMANAPRTDG